MNPRRVWIVGAGKRVRETALPAFLSLPESFTIAGVLARTGRDVEMAGRRFAIRALSQVSAQEFAPGDIVYVAAAKDAVPSVLLSLATLDRARLELLIDTPVLRFKHLRHAHLLEGWSRASVAEDVAWLPWYEAARAAVGDVRSVLFDRSAFAYHGLAAAKTLCHATRLVRARRTKLAGGAARREIEVDGGRRAVVIEPRDYATGRFALEGTRGRVTDRREPGEDALLLEPIVEDALCTGFHAGDVVTRLTREESLLTRGDAPGASVTARMASMKRIGFRRLALAVAEGRGAYPIQQGLDDMTVDWFLERLGRWRANGILDVMSRGLWSALGRLR